MILSILLLSVFFIVPYLFGYFLIKIKYIDLSILKSEILLFPFLGISIIISFLQNTGLFFGSKVSSIILLLLFIILILFYFKKDDLVIIKSFFSNYLILVLFCIVSAFITLYPSIYAGFPTSFASINNDLIFYLSIPEWLKNKSYFDSMNIDNYHPFFSIAELHFSRFSRVGADYFNTLFMNWLNIDSIFTFNVISSFFCILIIVSIFYTSKFLFKLNNFITYSFTALATFNTVLFWMLTTQYMPQLGGNAFFILSLGLIYKTLNEKKVKLIIPTSISCSALVSIYSEYLIYFVIPVVFFLIIKIISEYKKAKEYLKISIYIFLGTIIVNPISFYLAIKYNLFVFKSTQNAVGIVNYIPFFNQPLIIMGIKFLNDYQESHILFKIISIIIVCVMIFGIFKLEKRLNKLVLPLLAFIFLMLIYLKFINKFPYGYYKTLMFGQLFFIMTFCNGLYYIFKITKRKILYISIFVCVLCSINIYKIIGLEEQIIKEGTLITKDYLQIEEIKNLIPKNEIISVSNFNIDDQHVISYFLRDRNLIFNNASYYFPSYNKPEKKVNFILSDSSNKASDILKLYGEIIWNNNKFVLYKNISGLINIDLQSWNGPENWNGVPTRWTKANSKLIVESNITDGKLVFDAYLPPGIEKRTMGIYCNNEFVEDIEISNNQHNYITSNLRLDIEKKNEIEIFVKEGTVNVGKDTRDLGIALQNIFLNPK
ncbi:hypothetical protein [Paenibacillus cremeus]|uniref:Glycosyltransferase RgtA/B/C/D-like domain-containing protein n=1 Tax=Paenibacillus cremeus TaxID=2163881 RepID=A0A559KCC5_9BACL|nr:hypothetical protein [Paenibacillus cremeus]TVY09780.1 hypothetical protein FPZ49_12195 [Paenibacillus cremeus]